MTQHASARTSLQPPTNVGPVLRGLIADLSASARCLDVGCGGGAQLAQLPNAIGADRSECNVEHCRSQGMDAIVGDVERGLPWPDGSFDFVLMSHVLEHVDSPVGALRELRRLVKPHGRVAVGVPIEHSLQRVVLGDHYFRDHEGHIYSFSPGELRALFAAAGLESPRIAYDVPFARRVGGSWLQRAATRVCPAPVLHVLSGTLWAIAEAES